MGKVWHVFLVLAHLKPCTKERKQRLFAIDIHLSWQYQAAPQVRVHICLLDDHLSGWALASYRFENPKSYRVENLSTANILSREVLSRKETRSSGISAHPL